MFHAHRKELFKFIDTETKPSEDISEHLFLMEMKGLTVALKKNLSFCADRLHSV
jgi:hypothetical protein